MPGPSTTHVEPASAAPVTARRFLVLLCGAVVLVRATYVARPLRNDEGGYLLIARHWRTGGEFLYGDYFVDRPPLLMLIFKLASLSGWDQFIRVLAIPFVVLFVVAGWRAGTLLGGRAGGRWAAGVAAGVLCSPGLAAEQADGELFGAAFVMVALAAALCAWHADSPRRRQYFAVAAGATAACAPLVKQNLLEGGVFVVGLLLFGWAGHAEARRRAVSVGRSALLGSLLPGALCALWLVVAGIEVADAWRDLVGFRGAALDAIWSGSTDASIRRAGQLLVLGLATGLLPVAVTWFAGSRDPGRGSPEHRSITLILVFGLVAIVAGGSYWPAYLLQLGPAAVLAAGALAPRASTPGVWMRRFVGLVVAAALVGAATSGVVHATAPSSWYSQRIGEWLASSKEAADTGLTAYGLPSVLETADMESPYPHLWSVPVRAFDAEQHRLRNTLAGRGAPAWIVEVTGLNAWGIDKSSRLRNLVADRYRVAAEICGHRVWLRRDLTRETPPPPPC